MKYIEAGTNICFFVSNIKEGILNKKFMTIFGHYITT